MTDSSTSPDAVFIERIVDAPVELVWQLWTDAEHFRAWYGPPGADIPEAHMDVRVGGTRLICMAMETPDGSMQMWFTGEYREIVPGVRLVYTDAVCDEHGTVLPASATGMPDGHPTVTEVIVELEDLAGQTRMTLTHIGVPADSPGAQGWEMAFAKMAAHVAALPGRSPSS